ncbi:MAG: carboxypeptidase regulatory-like domain-containing protein, partial [Bryobacteraceae bacterium]
MKTRILHQGVIGCCALVLTLGAIPRCLAQTTYGSIVGTARDATGAVISGLRVVATNEATGVKAVQLTNNVGSYSFTTLFPGKYGIHAEMKGFRPVDVNGIQLEVNQTARFDLSMEVGQVSERMQVAATLATLSTDTSDVGQVVENRQVVDLPLNGREYLQLAALTNGVFLTGSKGGESAGPEFSSQGVRMNSDSFLIGGVETRVTRNSTYGLGLSVDAIGEFKILQNSFSAEYGRGASIVNATIKNGTNEFHGTLFEFLRNNALDARYAYNFTNHSQPLRQNQFGASIGGPIRRNKLFFFSNYEGQRVRISNVSNVLEPTAVQLGGDLSGMSAIAKDPATGAPFPGNIVPANRISQFAQAGAQY